MQIKENECSEARIITLIMCDIKAEGSKENHLLIYLQQPDCISATQAWRAHGRAWTSECTATFWVGMKSLSCCRQCRPYHLHASCPVGNSLPGSVLWDAGLLLSCPKLRKTVFFLALPFLAKLIASRDFLKASSTVVQCHLLYLLYVFPFS